MKHKIKLSKPIYNQIIKKSSPHDGWLEMIQNTELVEVEFSEDLNSLKNDFLDEKSALFQYVLANGGKLPKTSSNIFESSEYPYTTIFTSKNNINTICRKGKLGIADEEIPVNPYKIKRYFKKFLQGDQHIIGETKGWEALLHNRIEPINSALIIDPYLFHLNYKADRTEDKTLDQVTEQNLVSLLDQILPKECDVPFHLLIATRRAVLDKEYTIFYSEKYYESIFKRLEFLYNKLRDYPIALEIMVTNKLNHSRKIVTNYYTITCDKGFKLFKNNEVLESNDFRMEPHFLNTNENYGDIQFKEVIKIVKELKEYYKNLKQNIDVFGVKNNERYLYFTNHNVDQYPFNRLLNL